MTGVVFPRRLSTYLDRQRLNPSWDMTLVEEKARKEVGRANWSFIVAMVCGEKCGDLDCVFGGGIYTLLLETYVKYERRQRRQLCHCEFTQSKYFSTPLYACLTLLAALGPIRQTRLVGYQARAYSWLAEYVLIRFAFQSRSLVSASRDLFHLCSATG